MSKKPQSYSTFNLFHWEDETEMAMLHQVRTAHTEKMDCREGWFLFLFQKQVWKTLYWIP